MEELLNTFCVVAEQGSFNRAAAMLHLTPAAVRKRVDALESLFEAELFDRGKAGLRMLPAGASLLEDAPGILAEIAGARQRARCASAEADTITIGFFRSRMLDLLQPVLARMEGLPRIQIDHLGTSVTATSNPEIMRERGIDIVLIPGEANIPGLSYSSYCRCHACLSVPVANPLSTLDKITPADLEDQTVVMVDKARSRALSSVSEWLRAQCEHTRVIYLRDKEYGFDVPNECAMQGHLLLSVDDGACVHPAMRPVPVAWPFMTEYCLAYPTFAPHYVKRLCLEVHAKSAEMGLLRSK